MSPRFDNRKTLKVIKPIVGRLIWFWQGQQPVKPIVFKGGTLMRTIPVKTLSGDLITVTVPTRQDIDGLKVGDVAPFVFGESPVTEIYARNTDANGKRFVCFYVNFGPNSQMSSEMKEDQMHYNAGRIVGDLAIEVRHMRSQVAAQLIKQQVRQ
jgi:hypothetical protein